MAELPWDIIGFMALWAACLWFVPTWRGRRVLFGVRVSEEQRGGAPAQTVLWAYRAVVVICWWSAVVGVWAAEHGFEGLLIPMAAPLFLVPALCVSLGWLIMRASLSASAGHSEEPVSNASKRTAAAPASATTPPGVRSCADERRWRFVSPCVEAVLWGLLAGPTTLVLRETTAPGGGGRTGISSGVVLVLAMVANQVVGLWATVAVGRLAPSAHDEGPMELVRMTEQYLRGWVGTLYWLRAGTLVVAGGVLCSYLMERDRVDEGLLPIGVGVAMGWSVILWGGLALRIVADIVDRGSLRPYLGDDALEAPEGAWFGAYINESDPRVIVNNVFRPLGWSWVLNMGQPVTWALLTFSVGFGATAVMASRIYTPW